MAKHRKSSWDMYPDDETNLKEIKRKLAIKARGTTAAIRYALKDSADRLRAARADGEKPARK